MNCIENISKTWTPCEDVLENFRNKNYAIVVLNCRININVDHRHLLNLWTHGRFIFTYFFVTIKICVCVILAKLRVTVDGGTKRWLSWLQAHECDESYIFSPDLITGDMDSLPSDVIDYFKQRNSKVIQTPDQNETDFTKALRELQTYCKQQNITVF